MNFEFQNTLDLTGVFGEYIIHNLFDSIWKYTKKNSKNAGGDNTLKRKYLENLILNHFSVLCNWSSKIEFFGLSVPLDTLKSTDELAITSKIRKLYSDKSLNQNFFTEIELINIPYNILILGDPGSGKTTTLKRIVQKIIFSSNERDSIDTKFPILIRLKDLKDGDSIYKIICNTVGIPYENISDEITYNKTIGNVVRDEDNKELKIENTSIRITETIVRTYAGEFLIEDTVCRFLNDAKIILILDGYDELPNSIKASITKEIEYISDKQTTNSKILMSCRSGDYHKTIRGFSLCEVCPLNIEQVEVISGKWLKNSSLFFNSIKEKPYFELTNRPLFLGHLLMLFEQGGELPNNAYEVYEKIILLLIRKWDFDRDITRKSAYANFENDDKQKFLEELSYVLTYQIKTKVFNSEILTNAYLKIYQNYSLPKDEAEKVANEIESHNGLVVKSYGDNYEFCHLILQEYLCAKYLITIPFSPKYWYKYLIEYPAPIAICVALSRNSALWFANFVLRAFYNTKFPPLRTSEINVAENCLYSFLSRVIFERPQFKEVSIEFGLSLLYIMGNFGYEENDINEEIVAKKSRIFFIIKELLKISNVQESLIMAISMYKPNLLYGRNVNYINIRLLERQDFRSYEELEMFMSYDNTLYVQPSYYMPKFILKDFVEKNSKILKNYNLDLHFKYTY